MTISLNILHGQTHGQTAQIYYALPKSEGLEGSAKIANKFACLFLRIYDPVRNRGTPFVTLATNGGLRTDSAVITNFTAAVLQILQQPGDQSALPATEQLIGAKLLSHTLFSDNLTMTVQLLTNGGAVIFVLPLTSV